MSGQDAISIAGVEYHRSACCKPVPGDEVFGFVTQGRGISLHRVLCVNAQALRVHPDRIVEIAWSSKPTGHRASTLYREHKIHLESADKPGMLSMVTEAVSALGINIVAIEAETKAAGSALMTFSVKATNDKHINKLLDQLKNRPGILKVRATQAPNETNRTEQSDEFNEVLFASSREATERAQVRPLIAQVNRHLIRLANEKPNLLRELSPRLFEEFIAELFDGFGYAVELTAQSHDGGRDVVAIRKHDDVLLKYLIECKFFLPPHTVGVGYVRQLLGVKYDEGASKAVLATTSFFTTSARALEERHIYELELKDYQGVMHWVSMYNKLKYGVP